MRTQRADDLYLCSIVKAELYYGAHLGSRTSENLQLLRTIFTMFPTLSFDDHAADHYGQIRAQLEKLGTIVGPYDMMIAAIARSNDLTVVTHNTKEFSRIPELKLDDWHN